MPTYGSVIEIPPIRVVLIENQQLFRAGIKALLVRGNGIAVVGEAASRSEALEVVRREQPDVILLELAVIDQSGFDLILELVTAAERTRILILAATPDQDLEHKALHHGASGLLSKDIAADVLTKAVERVNAGEVWLDHSTNAVMFDQPVRRPDMKPNPEETKIATLTGREHEVIAAVGAGLKNKQIGERLLISDVTVRHHLTSIYNKLGVTDRLELVIYAYRHGLVPIPR